MLNLFKRLLPPTSVDAVVAEINHSVSKLDRVATERSVAAANIDRTIAALADRAGDHRIEAARANLVIDKLASAGIEGVA